jgi:hypothetical protein
MNFHWVSKEANIHHLKSSASFLSQRICIASATKEVTSTVLSPALALGLANSQLPLPDLPDPTDSRSWLVASVHNHDT